MRALLTDLDRTLTGPDLVLDERVRERIRELRESRIAVLVVTGRPLPHLVEFGLDRACDALVAENGAVVSIPRLRVLDVRGDLFAQRARRALGDLADAFHWGRVMGSGLRERAGEASRRLSEAGVAHELSFNAEEVMLLPQAVDKASGAARALDRLGFAAHECGAIGDGENDVPLFRFAGRSGAPSNAAAAALAAATVRLAGAYADGFLEFTAPFVVTREVPVERPLPVQAVDASASKPSPDPSAKLFR